MNASQLVKILVDHIANHGDCFVEFENEMLVGAVTPTKLPHIEEDKNPIPVFVITE